jgi:protein-S-isoprenylcysteine O-methyltransferase Ste14
MNRSNRQQQTIRFLAGGSVTLFMVAIVFLTINTLNRSLHHLLWGLPVIAVSLLDIYFLSRSLLQKPKTIDSRISSLLIGLGTTFGFSVAVMVFSPQNEGGGVASQLRQIGAVLSLLPYPVVIWSLFCLGDCLTVVPEAHAVVAHGPYKFSRHPLYVCYMTWAVANVLMFPTAPMLIAATAQIVFLLTRLRREEALLLETFPEYRQYYERTGLVGSRARRLASAGN